VHHKLIYIKNQRDATWQYCLLVTSIILYMFRTLFRPSLGALKNCSNSLWCTTSCKIQS